MGESNPQDPNNLNEFALLGFAGLVGIFARFVVQWLRDRLSQVLHRNEPSDDGDQPVMPIPSPPAVEHSDQVEGGAAPTQ